MDGKGLAPLATNHFVAGAVLSTSEDGLKLETSEIHNEKIDAERRRARLEQGRADDGGLYEILAQAKVRKEQEFIEMHKPCKNSRRRTLSSSWS